MADLIFSNNKDIQPNRYFDLDVSTLEQVRKMKACANRLHNDIAVNYDPCLKHLSEEDKRECRIDLMRISYLCHMLLIKLTEK